MSWKLCLCGLVMTSLLGRVEFVVAQEKQTEEKVVEETTATTEVEEAKAEPKKVPRKLKVFELKNCQPSQFVQLLTLPSQQQVVGGGITSDGRGATIVAQYRAYQALPENVNVAVNDEKRLLFVRAPAERIKEVEKLVKAFDVAGDKLKKQTFGKIHLIPLRGSTADQVHSILSELGMQTQAVQLGEASIVVVSDSGEEELEQIEEVIAQLESAESEAKTTETEATTTSTEKEERR
jgi:hypothetical protein